MRQQYGLRIRGDEFREMSWDEFADLLGGLNEQTPLVRLAQVRTESDPHALKDFTSAQRAERSRWQARKARKRPVQDVETFLSEMQKTFSHLFAKE